MFSGIAMYCLRPGWNLDGPGKGTSQAMRFEGRFLLALVRKPASPWLCVLGDEKLSGGTQRG